MPFVLGTAGHIDHGKTSLVKALTGQDTDRLAEEKARGISIELGFAHLDLPDGTRAGVIDVPGHERFIRTMLAGAHGIDLVLFTVAADDGVMPQTVEHLDILHLLAVRRAIFVVTKVDLVAAARVADVSHEMSVLAAGTSLEGSPVVPFSSVTGEGLDHLRREIEAVLGRLDATRPPGYFRLPVDRVFVLQGHGVVATGTALQGEVRAGDRLRCLPGGQNFRVRSVQVHGEPVAAASGGQRAALNLSGQDECAVRRGDVLCDEQLTMTSDRFDASLHVRPSAPAGVKDHQRVRVHVGTAERLGRLLVLSPDGPIAPGHSGFCQIVLTEPVLALRGDRYIIRDETARRTLGGGVVLHPWPRAHRRRGPDLGARLALLQAGDAPSLAQLFLEEHEEFASSVAALSQFLNVRAAEAREAARGAAGVEVVSLDGEELFTTARKLTTLKEAVVAALREFHGSHPLAAGRDMEELRERLAPGLAPRLFRALLDRLAIEGAIAREGSLLRLPEHRVSLPPEERQTADAIVRLFGASPFAPPDLSSLARETGMERARLVQVLRVLERDRLVVRVAPDLYFLRQTLDDAARVLREEFSEGDEITPAMFRDRFQTTRKYAIPLLERLDVDAVTVRIGDRRTLKGAPQAWAQSPAARESS